MPAPSGSALAVLERVSRQISEETGFPQLAVVAFILVGDELSPVLPPARLIVTTGTAPPRVSIDLVSRDVTRAQFWRLYREARTALNATRAKPASENIRALLELVHSLGGPPTAGKEVRGGYVAFWRHVQDAWNRRHKSPRYTTWRGLEMAYRRHERRVAALTG